MAGKDDPAASLATARARLVDTIEREVRLYGLGDGTRELDPRVRAAMAKVPRERFVSDESAAAAYDNRPLPIGHRQTISQPLIVAAMSQLLHIGPGAHVLEVGTGSGYQTAVLAELADQVSTIEIVEPLAASAKEILAELGYDNIAFRCGDGAAGWPEQAPFDGILVTAAAREIPQALVDQLKPGGRLVIPIGPDSMGQDLVLVEKVAAGRVHERRLFSVAFVPLTGTPSNP
jgi:protein-L-isoaspartate(D-aspartate) O-methyltransferase